MMLQHSDPFGTSHERVGPPFTRVYTPAFFWCWGANIFPSFRTCLTPSRCARKALSKRDVTSSHVAREWANQHLPHRVKAPWNLQAIKNRGCHLVTFTKSVGVGEVAASSDSTAMVGGEERWGGPGSRRVWCCTSTPCMYTAAAAAAAAQMRGGGGGGEAEGNVKRPGVARWVGSRLDGAYNVTH